MNALRITALALVIFLVPAAYSDQLTGKVVGISDGDTITILTEQNQSIKVRMAEIDAPEKSSLGGKIRSKYFPISFLKINMQFIDGAVLHNSIINPE